MNTHRIHRVAKLTGLSKDVIRVWERRYGLIQPTRGANRYRNYTDDDVALLRYVRDEMEKGNSVGQLASLGREELQARMRATSAHAVGEDKSYDRLLRDLVAALQPLKRTTFERKLNEAVAIIPFEEALLKILLPLQKQVGQFWHDGRLGIATEHYVTKQVQQKIFVAMNQLPVNQQGPKVVVACPAGQMHEIGAQTIAYRCGVRGCRIYYLGPNLPVESLASLCAEVMPDLIVLSFPMMLQDREIQELTRSPLRQAHRRSSILAGGHGALAMRDTLERLRIEVVEDFIDVERRLLKMFVDRLAMSHSFAEFADD
jgi:methanogenic corrinoid protein MtbC1